MKAQLGPRTRLQMPSRGAQTSLSRTGDVSPAVGWKAHSHPTVWHSLEERRLEGGACCGVGCCPLPSGWRGVPFAALTPAHTPYTKSCLLCSSQAEKSINSFSHRKSVSSGRPWGICLQSLISAEGSLLSLVAQSCPALCDPMDCSPPGSCVHGDSPSKNTGMGCQALLQGIFPIQGSNPGLPHCRRILYHLSHQGSPCCVAWPQNLMNKYNKGKNSRHGFK